ncbi:hypothetical protein NMY3_00130 [Candidatus Nitrosocosmicus oleophilus]|jgi:hypothetical protein|uniref:Uncharacterized protein n=1 Tax=Candidatus Nitrosocosmicus oleophilus TaxID=1353260 RepID=A0A654LSJ6_9ARCH|nr:hypothetical protein [Candidatus Nitrosocosmicus oleophilus]ALI34344.1 hypothetical protein NMY3_00130 [Candidatus Nitrosocosmicus oleophilus]
MKNYEFVRMWILFHLGYVKSTEKASESDEVSSFTLIDIWRLLKLSLVYDYPTILELWNLLEDLQHDGLIHIEEDAVLSKSHLSVTSEGLTFLIKVLKESKTNSDVNRIKGRLYELWAREARLKKPFASFSLISKEAIQERLEKYLQEAEQGKK